MSTFTLQTVNTIKSVTLNNPLLGYESDIDLALSIQQCGGVYGVWDNGAGNDGRSCKIKVVLSSSQRTEMNEMFGQDGTMPTTGRGENVNMILGTTHNGFFPFGPDKGDVGTFSVRLINWEIGFAYNQPGTLWQDTLTFQLVSSPAYTLPTQVSQGSFSVCGITGLRVPQKIDPKQKLSIEHIVTQGGVPYFVDTGYGGDIDITELDFTCNQSKAAALINALITSGRAADFTITAPTKYYVFGEPRGSAGSYTVKMISTKLNIVHENFNLFTFKVSFWRSATL